jgi:hypothetical protein
MGASTRKGKKKADELFWRTVCWHALSRLNMYTEKNMETSLAALYELTKANRVKRVAMHPVWQAAFMETLEHSRPAVQLEMFPETLTDETKADIQTCNGLRRRPQSQSVT